MAIMRLAYAFTLTILLMLYASADAQATPVSRDEANQYYQNCVKQDSAATGPENMRMLCSCAAAKIVEVMTQEELQSLSPEAAQNRPVRDKMLLDVYAPCLDEIAPELFAHQCASDESLHELGDQIDVTAACGCVGERAGKWFKGKARTIISELLKTNPLLVDPVAPLMTERQVRREVTGHLVGCSSKNP